ncbi:MAG: hypothetical protein Q8J93_14125, partial [Xanthomonadales bacterium]|nr:hypothetical protein [Xanthomonadales bacterium]MDZ4378934.1 type IIL restriction-modification enzyme MmeI [Xanthomonadaceae bacterium]
WPEKGGKALARTNYTPKLHFLHQSGAFFFSEAPRRRPFELKSDRLLGRQETPAKSLLVPEGEGSKALHSPSRTGQGWPEGSSEGTTIKHRNAIETAAQGVLDARAQFPHSTLADLYDPLSMPPALVKAHQVLDRAVDAAYLAAEKAAGRKAPKLGSDAERVAFLFQRYQALTSLLPAAAASRRRKR